MLKNSQSRGSSEITEIIARQKSEIDEEKDDSEHQDTSETTKSGMPKI